MTKRKWLALTLILAWLCGVALNAGVPTTFVTGSLNLPSGSNPSNVTITLTPSQSFSVTDAGGLKYQVLAPTTYSVTNSGVLAMYVVPNTGANNYPDWTTYTAEIKSSGRVVATQTWQLASSSLPVTVANIITNSTVTTTPTNALPLAGGTMLGPIILGSNSSQSGLVWPPSTAPGTAPEGATYINSVDGKLYIRFGGVWIAPTGITTVTANAPLTGLGTGASPLGIPYDAAQTQTATRKITTTAALGPATAGSAGTGVDAAAGDHRHAGPTFSVTSTSFGATTNAVFNPGAGAAVSASASSGTVNVTFTAAAPNRNVIVNGDYAVSQRNTSFTASGYTLDRLKVSLGSGASATISQQTHTPGAPLGNGNGEPRNFLRVNRTVTGSTETVWEHRVEDVRTIAGEVATLSFWAKVNTGTATLNTTITQSFGTGGSTAVNGAVNAVTLTTSFQRFVIPKTILSVSGKTISATDSHLDVVFGMPTSAGTVQFDISNVQLESGPVATPFEFVPFSEQLKRCQRYYCKSFLYATAAAQNTGSFAGAIATVSNGSGAGAVFCNGYFPVPMRAAPTITTYSPNAATSNWAGPSTPTAAVADVSQTSFRVNNSGACSDQSDYNIHWSADAEL